jgi:hypothetical protein
MTIFIFLSQNTFYYLKDKFSVVIQNKVELVFLHRQFKSNLSSYHVMLMLIQSRSSKRESNNSIRSNYYLKNTSSLVIFQLFFRKLQFSRISKIISVFERDNIFFSDNIFFFIYITIFTKIPV